MRERGVPTSLGIALAFFLIASSILMLRQNVVPWRPGQWLHHDVVSRVKFTYHDKHLMDMKQSEAANRVLRIYSKERGFDDIWTVVEHELLQLPDRVTAGPTDAVPADLADIFDTGSATALRKFALPENRDDYSSRVTSFVKQLRDYRIPVLGREWPIIILDENDRKIDKNLNRRIQIGAEGELDPQVTYSLNSPGLKAILLSEAKSDFTLVLQPKIVAFTLSKLKPTYVYNDAATVEARDRAKSEVPASEGDITYGPDEKLVSRSTTEPLDQAGWQLLRAEHLSYISSLKNSRWRARVGVSAELFGVTCLLCLYIGFYQPRVVSNHPRAIAIGALLLSMLLLNQIAAMGTGQLYLFGTAPTLLVAMILAIGYDQRTAIGIGGLHGVLATIALDQGITFS